MFERLNGSFTMGEDASIVAQMKPEFKDSTRQSFSLSAPLRHSIYIRTVSKLGSVAGPVIEANGRLTFEDDLRSGGLLYFNYTVNQRPH